MSGIIGKKVGMTTYYNKQGKAFPCTVVQAGPCVITQIKTVEKDGYEAVQLGYEDQMPKRVSKALQGHMKESGATPKKKIAEVKGLENPKLGEKVNVNIFSKGEFVDVTGTSKGKGFQGVVKRHGFHGVGGQTHGQHNRGRAPGSIGAASYPARVFKGMRMGGHMGTDTVTAQNLEVLEVNTDTNTLLLKGPVPGHKRGYLIIKK